MNTVKSHKKELLKMFFLSVDKDYKNWRKYRNIYESQRFDGNNYFLMDTEDNILKLVTEVGHIVISDYYTNILNFNLKIWLYEIKLKRYFKKVEYEDKNKSEIDKIKFGLDKIQKVYVKDIRKEKLDKISS